MLLDFVEVQLHNQAGSVDFTLFLLRLNEGFRLRLVGVHRLLKLQLDLVRGHELGRLALRGLRSLSLCFVKA